MLDLINSSGGTVVTVSDEQMLAAAFDMASSCGVYASPEGGATLAAARQLSESGHIKSEDRVLLMNTGSGVKYAEAFQSAIVPP